MARLGGYDRSMGRTLFDKVWDLHAVRDLPGGATQLYVGLHLIHEVTSPQAFAELRARGLPVRRPDRTFATVDHIIPTDARRRPFADAAAEEMFQALERNVAECGITFLAPESGRQGIVHVVGPELGLTQPGMTIACGDSHTSTHGAFGAIAFGIGTSQIRDILATQTISLVRPRIRRIRVEGRLARGVCAKDVILAIIRTLGVKGGIGYAYEYAGPVVERFSVEERLTLTNMSIEGGARFGFINPDETIFVYLRGRPYTPQGPAFERAVAWWRSIASDPGARYDDHVSFDGGRLEPMLTWGITPAQSVRVTEGIPDPRALPQEEAASAAEALAYMEFRPGEKLLGKKIDVAFVGSCTNGRLSDLEEAARILKGRRVAPGVRALIVPGSEAVERAAHEAGLDEVFLAAGCQWRRPGCSMCLAMNPDRLSGNELCASSTNRNFKGRQGSPTGRTLLMSPAMVAAAAVEGRIVDVREYLG